MSAIHQFKCDKCGKKAKAEYNGEHYLFPADWVELTDVSVRSTDQHLCNECKPKIKKGSRDERP